MPACSNLLYEARFCIGGSNLARRAKIPLTLGGGITDANAFGHERGRVLNEEERL